MQLCVGNGVIDLQTGRLMPPMPSMHHSKMASVEYEAGATCHRFLQFLADIFPDDEELVASVPLNAQPTSTMPLAVGQLKASAINMAKDTALPLCMGGWRGYRTGIKNLNPFSKRLID